MKAYKRFVNSRRESSGSIQAHNSEVIKNGRSRPGHRLVSPGVKLHVKTSHGYLRGGRVFDRPLLPIGACLPEHQIACRIMPEAPEAVLKGVVRGVGRGLHPRDAALEIKRAVFCNKSEPVIAVAHQGENGVGGACGCMHHFDAGPPASQIKRC